MEKLVSVLVPLAFAIFFFTVGYLLLFKTQYMLERERKRNKPSKIKWLDLFSKIREDALKSSWYLVYLKFFGVLAILFGILFVFATHYNAFIRYK